VLRWGLGVYHGLCKTNLQRYLDEFVFRFIGATHDMPRSIRSSHRCPHRPAPYHLLIRKTD
jgi:hypothetical protein